MNKYYYQLKYKLKYFFEKFVFLKIFFSPFIPPKVSFYFGRVAYGVPYFYPRVWRKTKENPSYLMPTPKRIGFDITGLGWKTKWTETDYRFEYSPIWSFVFFKWQFCVLFHTEHDSHTWEPWLYYENNTDKTKSKKERVQECIERFPQIFTQYSKTEKKTINYYPLILKDKYKS